MNLKKNINLLYDKIDANLIIMLSSSLYIFMNLWTLFISGMLTVSANILVVVFVIPFLIALYSYKYNLVTMSKIIVPSVLFLLFITYFMFIHQVILSDLQQTSMSFQGFTIYVSRYVRQMIFMVPTVFFVFLLNTLNTQKYRIDSFFKYTHIIMISNYVLTIALLLTIDNNLARIIATGMHDYDLLPVSSYDVAYASVFAVIIVYGICKSTNWKNNKMIALLTLTSIYLVMSGFVIAIALSISGVLFYTYMSLNAKYKKIAHIILIVSIMLVLFTNILPNIFLLLSNFVKNDVLSRKYVDVANFLMYGEMGVSITERIRTYAEPLHAIITSKGLGIYFFEPDTLVSNHSSFLYVFATTGVLGITLLMSALYKYYAFFKEKLDTQDKRNLWSCIFVIFVVMLVFNPVFVKPTILIVLLVYAPFYISNLGGE